MKRSYVGKHRGVHNWLTYFGTQTWIDHAYSLDCDSWKVALVPGRDLQLAEPPREINWATPRREIKWTITIGKFDRLAWNDQRRALERMADEQKLARFR